MELSAKQQATELIKQANQILILTAKADPDSLGSALGLKLFLEKLTKKATIISQQEIAQNLNFLPQSDKIDRDLTSAKNFIISLDIGQSPVEKLGYTIEDNKLNIIITPESQEIHRNLITFKEGVQKYDLLIILDTPDLNLLGLIFSQNREIFDNIPIINIDHHSSNSYYGKINLVDLTATSSAEILISLIESMAGEKPLFDPDIATCLLTGVTADTDSFQNAKTTPKSLTVAAQLVASGARQSEIVANLYKPKSLATLRLWGRVLASIREDRELGFVWSQVSLRDLEQTAAPKSSAFSLMDQFLTAVSTADIIILLVEGENQTEGLIRTQKLEANLVAQIFNGSGDDQKASFILPGRQLGTAEKEVLEKIRAFQRQRTGKS